MNLSLVISSIKTQLGLYNITLPFRDEKTKEPVPTENVIHTIVTQTTIPIYSKYQPWIREGTIAIKDMTPVDKKNGIYMIPAALTTTNVQYVLDVSPAIHNTRGTFGDIAPAYGINRSVEGVITSMEYMMLANQMRSEPTFEYLGHNKVRLYGFPSIDITIKVACDHEPNGETIEEGCLVSFMQLAILDVKMFLYNTLKYYNDLPSAFGNTKLNIEEFNGAEAERTQLLERWDDSFHLDIVDWIEFF